MSQHLMAFTAANTQYALDVRHAMEVVRVVAVHDVPGSPSWVYGLMNLRGDVLPVVDVRCLLANQQHPIDLSTPIIIACHEDLMVGLLVDRVDDISVVASNAVSTLHRPCVSGVVRNGPNLTFVIDMKEITERTHREIGALSV